MAHIRMVQDGVAMGMVGADNSAGSFIFADGQYLASSVDLVFFVANRAMRVNTIVARVTVAGTDAGAVTAILRKVPNGTAIASGTALHSGTVNLKGTADTNQSMTISTTAADMILSAGDALALDLTGVLTLATGVVSVGMSPA